MPKVLFYAGTAFCLFLALGSAAESARQLQGASLAFAALGPLGAPAVARAAWTVVVALAAGFAAAAIFVRMAALLAPRNLFGAFFAVFSAIGSMLTLSATMLLQWRMVVTASPLLGELHLMACLLLGFFVSLTMLSVRPYFRIQASRVLSALVSFPLPIFALIVAQELFVSASHAPLPTSSPASTAWFATIAVLFFSVAVHCVRHRHLFIETTNLRELLDGRGRGHVGAIVFE
ncbi:MAG TPA: hypothetical protein VGR02_16180 [Thermoanaerobaculia bacterium]|jgi:hypothetical protein|nr:hypothetical protein [Thermoanaerobaculia bacterium]